MGMCKCVCEQAKDIAKKEEGDNLEDYFVEPSFPINIISKSDTHLPKIKKFLKNVQDSSKYFGVDQSFLNSSLSTVKNSLLSENEENNIYKNYKKIKLLGKGDYGEVWLVKNKIINNDCAMKIIQRCEDEEENIKIEKEIKILKYLVHSNIVKIYDIYITTEKFYIIAEYCPGGNLFEELMKRGKPLHEAECAFIMIQVLKAIRYFHKMRIIHLDIKPENIMITKRENNGYFQIKLKDFGLAAIYSGHKEYLTKGTSYFIAPEVLNKDYDEKCDLWSLGVSMYELLTFRPPFEPKKGRNELYSEIKTGKYIKKCYEYERLSSKAKDLLSKFLTLNPDERISAKDALDHDWFKTADFKEKNRINKIVPEMAKFLINNISTYQKSNRLKCTLIAYLVHNNTNLESCVEARKLFIDIDYNSDGKISYEELKTGIEEFLDLSGVEAEAKTKKIFDNLDTENTNYIEFEEFVRAAVDPTIFLCENYLKFAFNFFDRDKSEYITLTEIKDKFKEIYNDVDEDKMIEIQLKEIFQKNNFDINKPITLKNFYYIMKNILKN